MVGIILGQPFTPGVYPIPVSNIISCPAIIMNSIAHDGKSNWFEGVMLTAVYLIIAIGFYFIG